MPLKDHMQLLFSVKLGVLCNVAPATHRAGSERLVIWCKCPPERIHSLLKEYVQVFVESPCTKGSYDTRLERWEEERADGDVTRCFRSFIVTAGILLPSS